MKTRMHDDYDNGGENYNQRDYGNYMMINTMSMDFKSVHGLW
jgi:hypothetical protein